MIVRVEVSGGHDNTEGRDDVDQIEALLARLKAAGIEGVTFVVEGEEREPRAMAGTESGAAAAGSG